MTKRQKKKFWKKVILLVICIIAYASGIWKQESAPPDGFVTAEIERVVDGDTIKVLMDGESYRIRLVGMDCEESVHPEKSKNTEKGLQASEFTKSLLPEGTRVYLQKDTNDTDRYGRLLRYVWLELPEDIWDKEQVRTRMVNGILIDQDQAKVKLYPPDTMYSDIFYELEAP